MSKKISRRYAPPQCRNCAVLKKKAKTAQLELRSSNSTPLITTVENFVKGCLKRASSLFRFNQIM